jgi:hypothetical protein
MQEKGAPQKYTSEGRSLFSFIVAYSARYIRNRTSDIVAIQQGRIW